MKNFSCYYVGCILRYLLRLLGMLCCGDLMFFCVIYKDSSVELCVVSEVKNDISL